MKIVMVVTGGIAAYKTLEVIRGLRKEGVEVVPILTKGGEMFVTETSLSVLAEHKTYKEFSDLEEGYGMGHIELSRDADMVVVCPASADMIGQIAGGRASSLASALIVARKCPLMMCPSMNPEMWKNPAVVENVAKLRSWGVEVREPLWGMTACGEEGVGRLEEPSFLLEVILSRLRALGEAGEGGEKDLRGVRMVVTAGPTRERLDSVRVLTNLSTGLQGYELAREARRRGASVTLVSGPVNLEDVAGAKRVEVETAEDMLRACREALPCDVMIACAAVSDWYLPGVTKDTPKRPKSKAWEGWSLVPTEDVVASIGLLKEGRPKLVIGFSAETEEGEKKAREKMKRKGCDWMVVNDPREAMGSVDNRVTLLKGDEVYPWEKMKKGDVAKALMGEIADAWDTDAWDTDAWDGRRGGRDES